VDDSEGFAGIRSFRHDALLGAAWVGLPELDFLAACGGHAAEMLESAGVVLQGSTAPCNPSELHTFR
jgi:hypothetical protein